MYTSFTLIYAESHTDNKCETYLVLFSTTLSKCMYTGICVCSFMYFFRTVKLHEAMTKTEKVHESMYLLPSEKVHVYMYLSRTGKVHGSMY